MTFFQPRPIPANQQGQTLPLMASMIVVLFIMTGLAIDLGFAMVTHAALSKASDAAVLAGIRNYSQGEATATTIAQNAFFANYGTPGPRSGTPTPTFVWGADAYGDPQLTVTATVPISTFFIRILPQYATLNIGATAQTERAKVVMSLALDRSGSMLNNGGAQALPPAVIDFVDLFDNNLDQLSEASFSSNATLDVPMEYNFQGPIATAVNNMALNNYSGFGGATWSQGGLQYAAAQEATVTPPAGSNTVKVVVFFTDGRANTNQDNLACPSVTTVNYGGCSPAEMGAPYNCTDLSYFWGPSPPVAAGWQGPQQNQVSQPQCYNAVSTAGQIVTPAQGQGGCNCTVAQFPLKEGGTAPFSLDNVTNEAEYRAEQLALGLQNQGVYIYAIGMETPGQNFVNVTFLQQLANDPASPTFNPSLPIGEAVIAPSSAELSQAFQTIAQRILYRLTR